MASRMVPPFLPSLDTFGIGSFPLPLPSLVTFGGESKRSPVQVTVKVMDIKLLKFSDYRHLRLIIRSIVASDRTVSRSGGTWHSSIRRNSKGTSNHRLGLLSSQRFRHFSPSCLSWRVNVDGSTVIADNRLLLVTCSVEFGRRHDLTSAVLLAIYVIITGLVPVGRALDDFYTVKILFISCLLSMMTVC